MELSVAMQASCKNLIHRFCRQAADRSALLKDSGEIEYTSCKLVEAHS